MKPGCTEFTRTPSFAQRIAALLVIRRTAPLAAWEAIEPPNPPTAPKIELGFTIEPPPVCFIAIPAWFIPSQTPVWLIAIIRSQPSRVSCSTSSKVPIPALFTSTSRRPDPDLARAHVRSPSLPR